MVYHCINSLRIGNHWILINTINIILVTMAIELNPREERGKTIASKEGQLFRVVDGFYRVKSQSVDRYYDVNATKIGWKCNCPDHKFRGTKCKHIWAVQISVGIKEQVRRNLVLGPITITGCSYCGSENIIKSGIRHNKNGDIQRFACNVCKKVFSRDLGFKGMRHDPKAITTAMQLYFSGESLRCTQRTLKMIGTKVSHQTISNWITKYTNLMKVYVDKIQPDVSSTWRADEIYVKVKGDMKYLFALMDDETRYWIAQEVADSKDKHDARNLFQEAKEIAGKSPETLITDGLQSYHDAFNKVFYQSSNPKSQHCNAIKFKGPADNNKMERINGEIRDREKTMRGLKTKTTPILQGLQIFHNYIRPHSGLDGKTPSEACGIKIIGDNKRITLIENASQKARIEN
jgi:putative transposase